MFANKYHLDNLVAIVDKNNAQVDGYTDDVMPMPHFMERWEAFGWRTQSVDGHDTNALHLAFQQARSVKDMPSVILAHTIKGKGLSFAENRWDWHAHSITAEQATQGRKELG